MNRTTITLLFIVALFSCDNSDTVSLISDDEIEIDNDNNSSSGPLEYTDLPLRSGTRPETTNGVPHTQIGVELVPEVHEEMIKRIYSVPGIEDGQSVIGRWRGLSISSDLDIRADALIGEREYAHVHHDGSLHIFLEPRRASEAEEAGWAILHPFAVEEREGFDGYVMLYTPQSLDELDVTLQLIVDGFNYVTSQNIVATEFYD